MCMLTHIRRQGARDAAAWRIHFSRYRSLFDYQFLIYMRDSQSRRLGYRYILHVKIHDYLSAAHDAIGIRSRKTRPSFIYFRIQTEYMKVTGLI